MMSRKLPAHAPFRRRALARLRNGGSVALDYGGGVPPGSAARSAARRPAIGSLVRAIELVDDVGAAVLVSLLGEPHIALRQFRPLRPQHRALFPGSAGAQMSREGAVSVGRSHRLVLRRRLLNLCLSTHDQEPSRSSTVPLLAINSQLFDRLFSNLVHSCLQSRFPGSWRQGAR
jgi:hypothetical protein